MEACFSRRKTLLSSSKHVLLKVFVLVIEQLLVSSVMQSNAMKLRASTVALVLFG